MSELCRRRQGTGSPLEILDGLRAFHADDKHAQKIALPFVIAVLKNVDHVPCIGRRQGRPVPGLLLCHAPLRPIEPILPGKPHDAPPKKPPPRAGGERRGLPWLADPPQA